MAQRVAKEKECNNRKWRIMYRTVSNEGNTI